MSRWKIVSAISCYVYDIRLYRIVAFNTAEMRTPMGLFDKIKEPAFLKMTVKQSGSLPFCTIFVKQLVENWRISSTRKYGWLMPEFSEKKLYDTSLRTAISPCLYYMIYIWNTRASQRKSTILLSPASINSWSSAKISMAILRLTVLGTLFVRLPMAITRREKASILP